MQKAAENKKVYNKAVDEKILVVPRAELFNGPAPHGLYKFDEEKFKEIVQAKCEFKWRSKMEEDATFKQIIPYLIFKFNDKLFLMQRSASTSEQRLKNLYTLGIGGHIREADIATGSIIDWANREFNEEIEYHGNFEAKFIGLLNDERNFVGKVHIGAVFVLEGDSDKIKIRSELANGRLASIEDCQNLKDKMESWSQIAFDYLNKT